MGPVAIGIAAVRIRPAALAISTGFAPGPSTFEAKRLAGLADRDLETVPAAAICVTRHVHNSRERAPAGDL